MNSWILHARNGSSTTTFDYIGIQADNRNCLIDLSNECYPINLSAQLVSTALTPLMALSDTAGPWSHSFSPGCKATLPTSLTHIDYCSTIDIKPWRPDEVYGTVMGSWYIALRLLNGGCRGSEAMRIRIVPCVTSGRISPLNEKLNGALHASEGETILP